MLVETLEIYRIDNVYDFATNWDEEWFKERYGDIDDWDYPICDIEVLTEYYEEKDGKYLITYDDVHLDPGDAPFIIYKLK